MVLVIMTMRNCQAMMIFTTARFSKEVCKQMSEFPNGCRVTYNNDNYIVVATEGEGLLVKRMGSDAMITIPKANARRVLEEGKDTEINRVKNKING